MDIDSKLPKHLGVFDVDLPEYMHFLYLPVRMGTSDVRLPPALEPVRELIDKASLYAAWNLGRWFDYVYVSARRGWAYPGHSLNRPGWHCDGFGTEDLNFLWWRGPGTRFAVQAFRGIPEDHHRSMVEVARQVDPSKVVTPQALRLYTIDRSHVHSVPEITAEGERQFLKISLSNTRYNLAGNSHNYLFDYAWPMAERQAVRNDPHAAQLDGVPVAPSR